MARISTSQKSGNLWIAIYQANGLPLGWEINSKRLMGNLAVLVFLFILLFIGTLFFFRELELNRVLTERLIRLETEENMNQTLRNTNPIRQPSVAVEQPTEINAPAPFTPAALKPQTARVASLDHTCTAENCDLDLTLVPATTSSAEGSLVIILETEVPRIGTGSASSQSRKRFFIYPGPAQREELRPADISELPRKAFRFQKILETHTHFDIGKLVRPLAFNLYLFEKSGSLSFHERYPIATE